MREIEITRKKAFAAALIPYVCVIGDDNNSDKEYTIKNGKSIKAEIDNKVCSVIVVANTSAGIVFSNKLFIEEGEDDIFLEIITHFSFSKGCALELKKTSKMNA